jgi:hypothetical protein
MLAAALAARAQTNAVWTPVAPPALAAAVQPGEIIGNEQVCREFLNCGTNRFMFVLPPGLRSETQGPNSILLTGRDGGCYLTVAVFGAGQDDPASEEVEAKCKQIPSRFPGATKVEQFNMMVAGREAKGVQLRQQLPKVGERIVRVVWASFPGAMVEFTLNSSAASASQTIQTMDGILVSFRAGENGKIEIARRTAKS